jgi:predicted neuraminidase
MHRYACVVFFLVVSTVSFLGALRGSVASAATNDPGLQSVAPMIDPGTAYRLAERNFQGIPGIARTTGGRLWATWYGGGSDEGPDNYVMLVTSGDDGKTWSEFKRVIDPPGLLRTFDPGLWIDPQGKLWWFYMQSYGFWDGRAGVWAITTESPDEEDPRWSAPRRLADGIMMNKPTVLKNGAWLFPISIWDQTPARNLPATDRKHVPDEHNRWKQEMVGAHVYRSNDRGGTLLKLATVRTAEPSPDEHMFIERRDGSLWMLIRDRSGMAESVSADGGQTWTAPKPAKIPHAVSRFFIRRLRSGNLLLVKHNSPAVDSAWMRGQAIPKTKQGRSHLTAYLSDDDGKTWRGGLSLDERNGVSYPDGDEANDGRIFVIYDRNRKEEREILMARFTEADVTAGKLVNDRSALRLLVYSASDAK